MPLELFDVQAGFGGARPGQREPVAAAQLLDEMDRLGISRSLVRIAPDDLDTDIPRSTEMLFAECEKNPRLVACPVVAPSDAAESGDEEELVEEFINLGAAAVWIRPTRDYWLLADWCSGPLFEALQDRRLPVLCLERYVTLEQTAEIAGRYPRLPLVVAETNYRQQRVLIRLLRQFDNVYLSLGSNYTVHGGIEQLVAGLDDPSALLFGTGFPEAAPAMAVTQLAYADLDDETRQAIGSGNLQDLIEGIAR